VNTIQENPNLNNTGSHPRTNVQRINFERLNDLKVYKSLIVQQTVVCLLITIVLMTIFIFVLPILVVFIIFLFIGACVYLYKSDSKKTLQIDIHNQKVFTDFAALNNFQYYFEDTRQRSPGTIFNLGDTRKANHIISGQLNNLSFLCYQYSYIIRGGKSAALFDVQIMELTLPQKLPHMIIDSLVENGNGQLSTLNIEFDKSQKLELEGDFYKYFSLYAPDKYGISALTVIAPDVMEVLMKHASTCDIEIIDNKLYFYWPDVAMSGSDYEEKFSTVNEVMRKIQDHLTDSNIYANSTQAIPQGTTAVAGERLKKGKNWLTITGTASLIYIFGIVVPLSAIAPDVAGLMVLPLTVLILIGALYLLYIDKKKEKLRKELQARRYDN
jgi:hypothetical protein